MSEMEEKNENESVILTHSCNIEKMRADENL